MIEVLIVITLALIPIPILTLLFYLITHDFLIWTLPFLPLKWRYKLMTRSKQYYNYLRDENNSEYLNNAIEENILFLEDWYKHKTKSNNKTESTGKVQLEKQSSHSNAQINKMIISFLGILLEAEYRKIITKMDLKEILYQDTEEGDIAFVYFTTRKEPSYFLQNYDKATIDIMNHFLLRYNPTFEMIQSIFENNRTLSNELQEEIRSILFQISEEMHKIIEEFHQTREERQTQWLKSSFENSHNAHIVKHSDNHSNINGQECTIDEGLYVILDFEKSLEKMPPNHPWK